MRVIARRARAGAQPQAAQKLTPAQAKQQAALRKEMQARNIKYYMLYIIYYIIYNNAAKQQAALRKEMQARSIIHYI